MATFGENLRRERESRGITLAELAAATNISLRYLNALECNQFERLPGGVFNRGFVRAVARCLGLDEREWVAEFVRASREGPEVLTRHTLPSSRPGTTHQSWRNFVLLVILFGAALLAVHSVHTRRAAEAIPTQITPHPTQLPASATASPSLSPANASADRPTTLSFSPIPPEGADHVALHLQVDALEDAWVSVAADSRTLYEGLMKPRETRVFRAANQLALRTGNASALVLTLNGETLAPLGNPGEVKSITLTRKDLPRP